jgi:hypothetical protein
MRRLGCYSGSGLNFAARLMGNSYNAGAATRLINSSICNQR